MCFKLREALGTGPELWANLQVMHDLSSANLRRKSRRRMPTKLAHLYLGKFRADSIIVMRSFSHCYTGFYDA